ncbi:MAG: DUF4115 domain-containing protein [Thermodesulfovibrionales bacterium]|nr:DUF4115 domain-containing protein [Thermodesulfovibrionales bacterium]
MGGLIKKRREELGWAIEDIAAQTCINKYYLKAIEAEDFSKLPAEVYARGYIITCAKFLGIPHEQALSEYEKYLLAKEEGNERNLDSKPEDIQSSLSFPRKHLKRVVWLAPVFLVFAVYLAVSQQRHPVPVAKMPEPIPPISNVQKTDKNILPDSSIENKGITVEQAVSNGTSQAPDMVMNKKHRLDVVATDKVWLQVIIDGTDKKEALLKKGESAIYSASESFNILIGNAGGIKLIYDGKEIENVGSSGQVLRLNLPAIDESLKVAVQPSY